MIGKTWQWWQLWLKIKPNLRSAKFAEIKATLESKTHDAEKKISIEKQARVKASAANEKLQAEKSELEEALSKGQTLITDMEAKVRKMENEKKDIDRQVLNRNLLQSKNLEGNLLLLKKISLEDKESI